jgi:hypothetical protein
MTQHSNVKVTLIEESSANNPPKTYSGQIVEIHHEPDTVRQGVDGKVSRGSHPSTILWYGGSESQLRQITRVLIHAHDGGVLLDAEVNRNTDQPRDVGAGVRFLVL